jgi:L-cystine uptake protein TcyP (sodium:dicarboxylate symporter family)
MLYKDIITTQKISTVEAEAKISKIPNQRLVLDYLPKNRKAKITSNNHEKTIYTIQSILTIVMQGQIIPQRNQHQYLLSKLVSLLILN